MEDCILILRVVLAFVCCSGLVNHKYMLKLEVMLMARQNSPGIYLYMLMGRNMLIAGMLIAKFYCSSNPRRQSTFLFPSLLFVVFALFLP